MSEETSANEQIEVGTFATELPPTEQRMASLEVAALEATNEVVEEATPTVDISPNDFQSNFSRAGAGIVPSLKTSKIPPVQPNEPFTLVDRITEIEQQLTFPFETFDEGDVTRSIEVSYPSKCATESQLEEIVTVRFRVNRSGRPYRTGIAATTNECLNKAALAAAKKSRFNSKKLRERTNENDNFVISYVFEKPTNTDGES